MASFNNWQRRRGAGWGVGATPAERKGGITRGIPEQALPKHTSPIQGVFQICLNNGKGFLFNHLCAIVLSVHCAKSSGTRTIYLFCRHGNLPFFLAMVTGWFQNSFDLSTSRLHYHLGTHLFRWAIIQCYRSPGLLHMKYSIKIQVWNSV